MQQYKNDSQVKRILEIKDIAPIALIVFIGILFSYFYKTFHQTTFTNLDEILWIYRSRFFMDCLLGFDFTHLIRSTQPGIMVTWISGPFMKTIDLEFFENSASFIRTLNEQGIPYSAIINSRDPQLYSHYKEASFLFNIPIITIILTFIFFLYYLMTKLNFNKWTMIFSLTLITTTPYYIYFTTPADKLVGIFSTLSILTLLVYTSKKGDKKFLALSAILGSWAVLSKLPALFLIPFTLFVLILYNCNVWKFMKTAFCLNSFKYSTSKLKNTIKDYLCWVAVFFTTSIIFFPTIIFNHNYIIDFYTKKSIKKIAPVITSAYENHSIASIFEVMLNYLSDPFLLSFNLFAITASLIFMLLTIKKIKNKIVVKKEIIVFIVYSLSFFVFISLFGKIYSFRYLVPALIVFQIVSGNGIYEISKTIIKRKKTRDENLIYSCVLLAILISQVLLIYYSRIEKIEN